MEEVNQYEQFVKALLSPARHRALGIYAGSIAGLARHVSQSPDSAADHSHRALELVNFILLPLTDFDEPTEESVRGFLDELVEYDSAGAFGVTWAMQKTLTFTGWTCGRCRTWELESPGDTCPVCGNAQSHLLTMFMETLEHADPAQCDAVENWTSPVADAARAHLAVANTAIVLSEWESISVHREGLGSEEWESPAFGATLLDPSARTFYMVLVEGDDVQIDRETFGDDEADAVATFVAAYDDAGGR